MQGEALLPEALGAEEILSGMIMAAMPPALHLPFAWMAQGQLDIPRLIQWQSQSRKVDREQEGHREKKKKK